MFVGEIEENINETLENEYPEILKAIQDESYEIDYPEYLIFHKIEYMGKTAGFITFIPLDFRRCEFMINEFYIMPEYRHYDLFKSELFNLIINPNFNFYFRKPSIATVESLIDSGFAFKLNEKIAWSYFLFAVETGDMYTSKRIKRHIRKLNINSDHYACFSPYYDLDVGGVIFKNDVVYEPFKDDLLLVSKPRSADFNKKKLDKIRPKYLTALAKDIYFNKSQAEKLNVTVQEELSNMDFVDRIIGSENELTDSILEKLSNNDIAIEEGFKYRNEIIKAIGEGEIKPRGILKRFDYIMSSKSENPTSELSLKCPHCGEYVEYFLDTCISCGHDLESDNLFCHVRDSIEESEGLSFLNSGGDKIPVNSDIYSKLLERIDEKEYDYEEVFKAQRDYVTFCQLSDLEGRIDYFALGMDSSNFIREGSSLTYAIRDGLVRQASEEEYRGYLNKFDVDAIKDELFENGIDIKSDDKKELVDIFFEDENYYRLVNGRFILTKKGEEFINSEIMQEYAMRISSSYVFYEFKKLYEENKTKLSLDEIFEKFLDETDQIKYSLFG